MRTNDNAPQGSINPGQELVYREHVIATMVNYIKMNGDATFLETYRYCLKTWLCTPYEFSTAVKRWVELK